MLKSAPTPPDAPRALPPLLSLGLRPFFLGAAVFAVVTVLVWTLAFHGVLAFDPAHGALGWHMHEMIYGFTPAVLAGFLLTAVPNWTGRTPLRGRPLAGLAGLWLLGRLAMAAAPLGWAAALDALFLPVLALVAAREILGGRNFRNLVVLVPVTLVALGNVLFHLEALGLLPPVLDGAGLRLGLGAVALLLLLIGGRITPAFTRNWLQARRSTRLPAQVGRFDGLSLASAGLALLAWVGAPEAPASGALLLLAAGLNGLRLLRWAGWSVRGNPILFVLHLFFAAVPLALAVLGAAVMSQDQALTVAGLHLLGIAGIGGMTLSVMTRASLGHTGRPLQADRAMIVAFGLIALAAVLRALAGMMPNPTPWIDAAGLGWMAAFTLFVLRLGPALVRPRPDGTVG